MEIYPIKLNGETHGIILEDYWSATWEDSFKRCNELGMTLPVPTSDADNTSLMNFLLKDSRPYYDDVDFYIGVYNGVHKNEKRKWANLYTNKEITFSKWAEDVNTDDGDLRPEAIFDSPSEIKVAFTSQSGEWRARDAVSTWLHDLICVTVDYKDWEPTDMDFGEFLCKTGMNECHISSTCADYTGTTEGIYYQCECSDVTVDGINLKTVNSIVDIHTECRYTHPDLDVEVAVFNYDGKPTIYHSTSGLNINDAVQYCSALDMHLPVPNTEKQFQDLRFIPEIPDKRTSFWLGFTDAVKEGTWLNIYNDEELVLNKWYVPDKWDGPQKYADWDHAYQNIGDSIWYNLDGLSIKKDTICMKSDLKSTPDFCGKNVNDCSGESICTNEGSSYTCTCPTIEFNNLNIEPASSSTGKGYDPCHYFHPNDKKTRLFKVNYGGRETFLSVGFIYNYPTLYDYAVKCQSLGMKMLIPKNIEEAEFVPLLKGKAGIGLDNRYKFSLGITRRKDGHWRNIYTNEKLAWENFSEGVIQTSWGYRQEQRDFAHAQFNSGWEHPTAPWYAQESFGSSSLNICISPEDDESIEIDFCGTGFNDCHEASTCTNDDKNGFTCECQPFEFGDVFVEPINRKPGKECEYIMPGHDDKKLYPLRVGRSNTVYAFHTSDEAHDLQDAIKYCDALGKDTNLSDFTHTRVLILEFTHTIVLKLEFTHTRVQNKI